MPTSPEDNACDSPYSSVSDDFTMNNLYFSSTNDVSQDNPPTLLDPKLEVVDSNTPLFFIALTPQQTPTRELQPPATQNDPQVSHFHQTVFNTTSLGDMHQQSINNFMPSSFSQGMNFAPNGINYLEYINGTDNSIEPNISSTQADRQCQVQDISDKGLQIRVLGVPQTGAKSRVETQIKLCLQLVTDKGEKVPLWSHLRLPEYMVAKEKLKTKNARNPQDSAMNISEKGVLNLEATVVCASEMPKKVLTCLGCVQRERKRSQRKKENKHSKTNPNATSNDDSNKPMDLDDEKTMQLEQRKILLFNCSEIVDFSSGDTILPTRITCYCRHHNEKVGFCIYFVMKDYANTIIATGMSPPIMITDDHKSSKTKVGVGRKRPKAEYDRRSNSVSSNSTTSAKNKINNELSSLSPTPTGESHASSSILSPNSKSSELPSSPSSIAQNSDSISPIKQEKTSPNRQQLQIQPSLTFQPQSSPTSPLSPVSPVTPITTSVPNTPNVLNAPRSSFQNTDQVTAISTSNPQAAYPILNNSSNVVLSMAPTQINSVNVNSLYQQQRLHPNIGGINHFNVVNSHQGGGGPMRIHNSHSHSAMLRRSFYNAGGNTAAIYPNSTFNGFSLPRISRLIPSEGPTYGGVEVTVLGSNFYDGLTCIFGETPAIPTQYWSPNTLVCLLPPSPTPGPVVVSFKEFPINLTDNSEQEVIFFNYNDDSDRALMELALQVVGMKMTGKLEDARNIAMRIVGGTDNNQNSVNNSNGDMNGMQHHLSSFARQADNFEEHVIATLALMDAFETEYDSISLQNRQQHTMLHMASMLGYKRLCAYLIEKDINVDMQDKYGFTALHYSAWTGREDIVRMLLTAGSDDIIRNSNEKTASDLAASRTFHNIVSLIASYRVDSGVSLSPTSSEEFSSENSDYDSWYNSEDDELNLDDDRNQNPVESDYGMSNVNISRQRVIENVTPNISWVDAETASGLLNNKLKKDDGIIDAEVVDEEKKTNKQPLSEIATDLATASTIWLQRTFAHMHMPNIGKPPQINIHLPNIKMPNLQMPNLQMPNLQNFSSPKFSTMTFGTNLSIPRPSMPSMPSLSNIEFPTLPTVTFPTMIMPTGLANLVKDEKNMSSGAEMCDMKLEDIPQSYWDHYKKTLFGQGEPQQQPEQLPKDIPRDATGSGYPWPFNGSQPIVPMYPHKPEETLSSRSANLSHASRRVGYDIQDLNEYQLSRVEQHTEKFRRLKQDKMLYLFWVPIFWVMIALAIVQFSPFGFGYIKSFLGL
ncbi:Mga2p [Gigaspora margarita]|uniref:Mga2p n=1 Tax=Gigaspora margarita TaxID=4874 RepID=A0A8H4A3D7_GIGMA|nr:Mga2p [Gigaspora margarita]